MNVTKYEIDMLDVKAADAILIHFWDSDDNDKEYIVLIDAGNYSNGKDVHDFIRKQYDSFKIDLAICSHCDKDHFGGFVWLLENMKNNPKSSVDIKKMWIIDPQNHISQEDVDNNIKDATLYKRARSVYDLDNKNLLDMLDEMENIEVVEPFSNVEDFANEHVAFDGLIEVIGPSIEYYEKKVVDFRNDLEKSPTYDDEVESPDSRATTDSSQEIFSQALEDANDDSSSHNQTSVIFLFKPQTGKKYLFMGDAGREAMANLKYKEDFEQIKNIHWLKVPHHGSKHNLSNELINTFNAHVAYISTEKKGHYLNMATVNALKAKGTDVYSTHHGGSKWHKAYAPNKQRDGYSTAEKL